MMIPKKMRTLSARRSVEWEDFLNSIIKAREENGEVPKLKKTELERLILRNLTMPQIKQEVIEIEITEREMRWIRA